MGSLVAVETGFVLCRNQARCGLGASPAQAADWPRLAEARGSLRHDLALKEASGEPAGRSLCHLGVYLYYPFVTGFMATLSGRQQARQQTTPKVNNGALVATSRQGEGEGGGEGEGEGSAAAVAECKLELVQQRTGLCVEEAR
eukprot:scaffold70154_cov40-Phaeocystis_antarctica.AAC.1